MAWSRDACHLLACVLYYGIGERQDDKTGVHLQDRHAVQNALRSIPGPVENLVADLLAIPM